jgi:hypothetical protein
MYKSIVFNLGCKGHGIISYYPNVWENVKLSEFRKQKHIKNLFKICKGSHVPPSQLTLVMCIGEKNFTVSFMNIREYRKFWENKYKKLWNGNKK